MQHISRRTGTRAVLALALSVAAVTATIPTAHAIGGGDKGGVHSVTIPLTGTFTGCGPAEAIDVTGTVHLTVHTDIEKGGVQGVTVDTNLSDTTGTGETTHATYQLTGSDSYKNTFPPGPVHIDFQPVFKIVPPVPSGPPTTCSFVNESIDITSDGTVTALTATVVSPE
jgi:hypothetical protein